MVIDPGQAFGTGAHPTTRLCLEALCGLEAGGPLVDVGCGSGVLAIAAAKLGWGPVLGLDHERGVGRGDRRERGGQRRRPRGAPVRPARRARCPAAPTIVANLLRPLLLHMAFEEVPHTLVASGLLAHEGDEVADALSAHGLRETRRLEEGGWVALVLHADQ